MAIVSIREGFRGHSAGGEADNKTSVRCFSLITDSVADDARFLWPQSDPLTPSIIIPAPGTFYPGWTTLRSKEPQVTKVSPTFFNVVVNYGGSVNEGGKQEEEGAADPLNQPAEESWDTVTTTEKVDVDADGYSYINKLGEPIEVDEEIPDQVLTIVRNEAAFDESVAFDWHFSVNAVPFRGAPRGRALIRRLRVEHVKNSAGEILYSKVNYEIYFRWKIAPIRYEYCYRVINNGANFELIPAGKEDEYAWYRRYAHQGNHYYNPATGKFPLAPDGVPVYISVVDGTIITDYSKVHWVYQKRYPFVQWAGLA